MITYNITYKGKDYMAREITVFSPELDEDDNVTITIAAQTLSDDMGDDKEVEGTWEEYIDGQIYHYVNDESMNLSGEEICAKHLDEVFEFICEGEEV